MRKVVLFPLSLIAVVVLISASISSTKPTAGNTPKEKRLIDSTYETLHCNCCSIHPSPEKNLVSPTESGAQILFKNGRVVKKGCFSQFVLTCGVECDYDSDTVLVTIRKIVDGKASGEVQVK